MADERQQPQNPAVRVLAVAAALAAIILLFIADVWAGITFNASIVFAVALLLTWWARNAAIIWGVAAVAVVLTWVAHPLESADLRSLIHRSCAAAMTVAVASFLHVLHRNWAHLERHRADLQANNEELQAREEEIARQNEKLQSQTEELERQSEEMRVTNHELAQREKTLEALLELSRSLTLEMTDGEALTRICETLGMLINGAGAATAILVREGDALNIRCHHGFGEDGPEVERLPLKDSFAALVLSQARPGYLEDLSLRPDVRIPQPADARRLMSVLSAPLIVRGRPFGTLEVYSRQQRSWTDQEIALVESLAAQTAISLENAELFTEIERERERLRAVLQTVPFGVAICDPDCLQMRLNPAGAALISVPPDAVLSVMKVDGRWLLYKDGQPVPEHRHPLVRAARHRETVYGEELELVSHVGRRFNLLLSAAPIVEAGGKLIGAVAAWADITAHKALQRELDVRRREAEEASVRKTRFLAAASHDIRTPANAISLLAELIKRTADNPKMIDEIPELAEELQQSAMSLVTLVTNVLDVSRFETGQLELHETEFALGPLLAEEVRQVLPLAQNKGLDVRVEEPEAGLWLRADRVKLGRVLGNLLGNAIKFTDRGSVRIEARSRCAASGNGAGGAEIRVSDTGIGISREHQQRIFDEFYQLADPDRSKGSGLGLAICKRLTEAMGGTLTVESEKGQGSTFILTLPPASVLTGIATSAPAAPAPAPSPSRQ